MNWLFMESDLDGWYRLGQCCCFKTYTAFVWLIGMSWLVRGKRENQQARKHIVCGLHLTIIDVVGYVMTCVFGEDTETEQDKTE